ncbi:MAG: DUF1080 domain-containing protein [Calditrichaeota bacterium]|nr:DUF1080 domain-containing protein [Calditrichota bacterium]
MKIKYSVLFLISIIYFNACSSVSKNPDQLVPIENLIAQFPTQNPTQQKLLFDAILDHGEKGITEIATFLKGENPDRVQLAKYALNGLAFYVADSGDEQDRLLFLAAIHQAIKNKNSTNHKTFLIDQLQPCAKNESIEILSQLLKEGKSFNAALRVLTTINSSESAQEILDNIEDAPDAQKTALINALSQMDQPFVAEELLQWADNENNQVKAATLFALSNFAYLPAKTVKTAASKKPAYVEYYVNFAAQLFETGEKQKSISILKEILKNADEVFLPNHQINALKLLTKIDKASAFEFVIEFAEKEDLKFRRTVLQTARDFKEPQYVQKWIAFAQNKSSERQIEIIELFADLEKDEAVPYLNEQLNSDSQEVRSAAFIALISFKEDTVFKSSKYLSADLSKTDLEVLSNKLLQMDVPRIKNVLPSFDTFSNPVKKVFIETLAAKNVTDLNLLFLGQLERKDTKLQKAVLKALANSGTDNELKILTNELIKPDGTLAEKDLAPTIVSINARSKNKAKNRQYLLETYKNNSTENKQKLMKVFSGIGHKSFLNILQQETKSANPDLQNIALRTLYQWQNQDALDILIEVAKKHKDETQRILAIRAATGILNRNKLSAPFALEQYKRIMEASFRPEEKRLVFAGLANLETKSSMQYLAGFLNDPDIGYDAFLTTMNIADAKASSNLSKPDVALALIKGTNISQLNEMIESDYQTQNNAVKPPPGFVALFNGKDLSGWKGLVENPAKRAAMSELELVKAQQAADSAMEKHWKVEDNILYFDGKGHSLCTAKDYQDFEMFVDWKIEKHGDSGIYLRGAPQVQIWDTAQWPEGSGGLYNNQKNPRKPLVKADNPIGEWNTFRIIMRGEKVTVYLNGVLVVDNVTMENYWERDKAIYPIGQIELQSHNAPLFFKNIFIKELTAEDPPYEGSLFNGKDLSGWQVINNKPDSWNAENGILFTTGKGGGWLSTDKEYDNFVLELEYKISAGGNSGVFLRAPHLSDPAYTGIEVQVLDDYAPKYSTLKKWQYTGSLYGLQAPKKRVTKESGTWQKMEISCIGPSIKVKLNGEEIIDSNLIDFMGEESSHPGIKRRKGFIGVQNHGSKVEYRNIKITEVR